MVRLDNILLPQVAPVDVVIAGASLASATYATAEQAQVAAPGHAGLAAKSAKKNSKKCPKFGTASWNLHVASQVLGCLNSPCYLEAILSCILRYLIELQSVFLKSSSFKDDAQQCNHSQSLPLRGPCCVMHQWRVLISPMTTAICKPLQHRN